MEAIVFVILQTFFVTSAALKIAEHSRILPCFSWGIFGHVTCLDQSRASKNIWWIVMADSIWVDQPVRLQCRHKYTNRILLKLYTNTELARVVDTDGANKENLVFLFFVTVFSKRNRKHVLHVLSSYRDTRESLGELEKAVETLYRGSCCHSISRSPKLSLVFLYN